MPMQKNTSVIPVIQPKQGKTMSRLQRQFNQRIQRIQKLKREIETVEKAIPEIRSLIHQELQPVQDKIVEIKAQIVRRLDKAWNMKFFRSKEKEKLQDFILHHTYDLIHDHGRQELEPIYDKHAPTSYQEEETLVKETSKGMASEMFKSFFGVDLDLEDVDIDDFGQVSEKLFESMEEKTRQEQTKKERKKTKAQLAKEEKLKEETANISKTSRAVYTRLVKEFHPDKERDEEKKMWKTETMKRVTQAYKQDDFFGLLSLEIELMQGSAHDIGELPDKQLKYYTKMLKDQVQELEMQLDVIQNPPPPFHTMAHLFRDPKQAKASIRRERNMLEQELTMMENDLSYFSDKKNIREYLRDYELEEDDDDDLLFFDFPG